MPVRQTRNGRDIAAHLFMLSFKGDYCGTQLSAAPTGVLLTELPSLFCTLFGLNTMATTPKLSLPSIIRLQHASMDATSHLAATTKSQQVLKFSSSMDGCTTWIEKWGRQEFLEDDGFCITSGSNVWEGAAITDNEDVVRLQFDDDNIPMVNTTSRTSPICYRMSGYWKPSTKSAPRCTSWT